MRCNPGHSHRHIHHHHHHHSHCGPCFGGSVFTVSHHCGGHSGGFWGGFGAGLGMGLGNMLGGFMNSFTSGFGNMFSGFGNMFGGFGMGGFGFGMPMMGGFGMGGFGMPWAASYGGGTVKDDAYFASKYGTGKSSSTSSSSSSSCTCGCGKEGVEKEGVEKEEVAATGKIGDIEIDKLTNKDASNIKNDDYVALGDTDKENLKKKFEVLAKGNSEEAAKWAKSTTLHDDLVKIARASFYTEGNTNYDGKEEIDASKIVRAHDTYSMTSDGNGFPRDVKPNRSDNEVAVEIENASDGNYPKTIKIYDDNVEANNNNNERAITYTYQEIKHGEYIYKSDRNNQEYVLQKTSNGEYELVQYRYHTGWCEKDANSAQS